MEGKDVIAIIEKKSEGCETTVLVIQRKNDQFI